MYLPENHARLKAAHTYVSEDLRALGIPFVSHGAGFFIWVDLRKVMQVEMQVEMQVVGWRWESSLQQASIPSSSHPSQYLPEATFEEEVLLWRRFLENKVLLSFGKAFECKEPGWFRLVFSDKTHRLRLGERSRLLTVPFSPPSHFWPHWGPSSPSWLVRTRPASMLTLTPAFPPPRDAEGPTGA